MMRGTSFGLCVLLSASVALSAGLDVQLTVRERHGENRVMQPVTSGVPLPEGAYRDVAKLRLVDVDGKEVPCQFTPTVKWFRDGSVRWVLLDFQASVPAFSARPFRLRDDGPAKPIENPVRVSEDADKITVDTGAMRFTVLKKGFNGIDEAWIKLKNAAGAMEEQQIVKPSAFRGPVLWSNFPNRPAYRKYYAAKDADCKVTVEETGPMRVAIKAVGKHVPDKAQGPDDRLLDYTIRLHAYRAQSLVRIVYSAECKQGQGIGHFAPVDRWHFAIDGELGKELTYDFGTEGAPVIGTFGKQDRAWLVCDNAEQYTVGGAAYHHATMGALKGKAMALKPERLGFVDLRGETGGITLAVRWLWQNYRKGLFAYRNGAVHAALWPSFVKKSPLVQTNDDRRANFFPGVSKTHELVIYLHGPKGAKRPAEVNAFIQRPLFAQCPPEWYCEKTRAFGRVASSRPALYDQKTLWTVNAYDHFFEQSRRAMVKYRDFVRDIDAYGMFNFGDCVNHVTGNRRANAGERHGASDIHWANNYYGFPHAMLIQFVRTGNLDMLEMAEQASTHLQDVDMHCWHPNPRFIGAQRYSAGPDHVRMYGRGDGVYTSNTYNHYKNQSLFERFWLLGDRRALEMGLLSAGFARTHTTNALSQSRSIGHGIVGLLSAYETTLDTSYLAAASKIIERTRKFRKSRSGAWIDGIALEGHRAWYELTGDKKAIPTVIGGVDAAMVKRDRAGAILQAIGFAYGQTGDLKYRDHLVKGLLRNARGRNTRMIGFGNQFRSTGYLFWYLTRDLPKKEDIPVLNWRKEG